MNVNLVKATLLDGKVIFIVQSNICTFEQFEDNHTRIVMSNGQELTVAKPSFKEWASDYYKQS